MKQKCIYSNNIGIFEYKNNVPTILNRYYPFIRILYMPNKNILPGVYYILYIPLPCFAYNNREYKLLRMIIFCEYISRYIYSRRSLV